MQLFIKELITQYDIQKKKAELNRSTAALELGKWQSRVELGINCNRPDMVQYAAMRVRCHTQTLKIATDKIRECEMEIERLKKQVSFPPNASFFVNREERAWVEPEYEIIEAEIISEVKTVGIDEELEDLRRQLDNL